MCNGALLMSVRTEAIVPDFFSPLLQHRPVGEEGFLVFRLVSDRVKFARVFDQVE